MSEVLQKGKMYHGNKPVFDTLTFQPMAGASLEMKRLSNMMKAHPDWRLEMVLFPNGLTEIKPSNPADVYEKMKTSLLGEMTKTNIPSEKITFTNGNATPEEENSYCGWAFKVN
jgi:hypothetical protein